VAVGIESSFEFTDFAPAIEIIIGVGALFVRYDLCEVAEEQRKRPFYPYNADCHIVLI